MRKRREESGMLFAVERKCDPERAERLEHHRLMFKSGLPMNDSVAKLQEANRSSELDLAEAEKQNMFFIQGE
jgi:hypothetical protein